MRKLFLTSLSSLMMLGCQTADEKSPMTEPQNPMKTRAENVAQANTYLGADLLAELSKTETGNVFISPLSLSTAMGMLYAGAEGETKTKIGQVMHYPETSVHAGLGVLRNTANRQETPENTWSGDAADAQILAINNSLWVDKSFRLKSAFLDVLDRDYGTPPTKVDFHKASDASRLRINDWVEDKTNDRIENLLSSDDVTPETAVILVNTVYMMAHWQSVFSERATQNRPFLVGGTQKEDRPLMEQELFLRRAKVGGAESIEIPYANDMSMIVILPPTGDGLTEINREISAENIETHLQALQHSKPINTDLRLPKFSLKARYNLATPLENLGMTGVFLPARSNLGAMTDDKRAAVSKVIQQVFLDVNEKGTEAAAATAAVIIVTSVGRPKPKPKAFHVDRPFLMLLKDNKTGAIVFMGRITNPEQLED